MNALPADLLRRTAELSGPQFPDNASLPFSATAARRGRDRGRPARPPQRFG